MLCAGGTALQIQHGVPGVIVEIDFAALMIDLNTAVHAVDGDIAPAGGDDQIGVAGHVDVHVGADAFIAYRLSVGGERYSFCRRR